MYRVSCDICKFSSPHDYVPNHYYCNKGLFFNDREPRRNCEDGGKLMIGNIKTSMGFHILCLISRKLFPKLMN